jgi:small-conductance mechanosensitive channel
MDMLLEIARKHPAVFTQPEPFAVFDRFAESALNFTLYCWSSVDAWFVARSELTVAINTALKDAGIEIPFPQQDVHLHWPDGKEGGAGAAELPKPVLRNKSAGESSVRSEKT